MTIGRRGLRHPGRFAAADRRAPASFGIPPEGIGIILGVERLLDMTRTMVNVGSDVVTTIVVDRYTKLDDAAPARA